MGGVFPGVAIPIHPDRLHTGSQRAQYVQGSVVTHMQNFAG